jgi:signal transduction histidine kinase
MGLRHRSIRLRVAILIVVPVLCLIALYGFAVSITLGTAVTQARANTIRTDLLTPIGTLQTALAAERGLAVLSLASPMNTQLQSELGVQEAATDKALDGVKAAFASPPVADHASVGEQQAIQGLVNSANKLTSLRSNVSDDSITIPAALSEYDAIVGAGYTVLQKALDDQANVTLVTQALDVISLDKVLQTTMAEANLLEADMAQGKFPLADRITFAQLAYDRQDVMSDATAQLDSQFRGFVDANVTPAISGALGTLENNVIALPWRKTGPPAQIAAGVGAFDGYAKALDTAINEAAASLETQTSHQADTLVLELVLAGGLGLVGTVVSVALSLGIGRGLVRQLRDLRESALTLANDKLPEVITQLRAGQQVDVADYAPADAATRNEIEQVRHAFTVVQQTAVQSAVDEARLRRGISDVFRNLAGRSQSLLHRQLTLLDGMERRATEPEELEDLFRIDHLTTRMRRHAEGLIILSGDAPARGWRQPVPLVDVLRAAVAEVEDYTRIRVLARTGAAVAGHAVADVIHLIAELAENATVFSPPNTPVRIQGDIVGRGIAVEIEDRGLGISQSRLDEVNANLANPPQFDLSGSDRLGLFIAGQLAHRHSIKITLRPSVFGGTTAIVLIPMNLVVEEDSYERDPALPAGRSDSAEADRTAGRHAALMSATGRMGNGRPAPDSEYAGISLALGSLPPISAEPVLPAAPPEETDTRVSTEELAELGLPVRVRQANLAPQLRDTPPAVPPGPAGAGLGPLGFGLPGQAGPGQAGPGQNSAGQNGAGQNSAGQNSAGQNSAGQNNGDQHNAGLGRDVFTSLPRRTPSASGMTVGMPFIQPARGDGPGSDGYGPGTGTPAAGPPLTGIPVAGTPLTGTPLTGTPLTGFPGAGPPAAGNEDAGASPEAARNTMSALQRGWLLGRAGAEFSAEAEAASRPASEPAEDADGITDE